MRRNEATFVTGFSGNFEVIITCNVGTSVTYQCAVSTRTDHLICLVLFLTSIAHITPILLLLRNCSNLTINSDVIGFASEFDAQIMKQLIIKVYFEFHIKLGSGLY